MGQAEYAIDIAARMTGAEATNSQLDALTANLNGAGKGAEFFQSAVQRVTGDLEASRAATVAANDALAAGQAEYRILEKAALQMAKAAEKAALKNGGVIPDDLKAKLDETNAQVDAYAVTLKGLEAGADDAATKEQKLATQLNNVKKLAGHVDKSISGQTESLAKLQGGLSAVGGPLGRLGSALVAPVKGFEEMSSTMGRSNAMMLVAAAGAAIVVAAILAIAAAAVIGTAKLAMWAIGLADAGRSAELSSQAFEAMTPELVGLRGEFAALEQDTGLGTAALRDLTKTLTDAKVSAADMPAALRAAALAEAALGKGGSAEFVAQIKEGKQAVSELANEAQSKLGGIVARQMLGLEAQSTRLKSNVASIFGGLEITPVLEGVQTLVGLFDKSTAAGQAMKLLFEKVFQPLIDQAQNAAYVVEAFALGFLIGLTKVYLFIKPVIAAVAELFGFDDTSLADVLLLAKKAGEVFAVAFVVVAAVVAALTVAITTVVGVISAWNAILWAGIAAFVAFNVMVVKGLYDFFTNLPKYISMAIAAVSAFAGRLLSAIGGAADSVRAYFAGLNWAEIGTNIVLGLARGITGSAGAVINAIGGVINNAIGSAKRLLGIASPSKVFAGIGEYTGEGFVGGVEDQTAAAQTAMADMVTPPTTALQTVDALQAQSGGMPAGGGASTASNAPASKGGGASVDLSGATFNLYGVEDAEHAAESFGEMLTRILEGDAAQVGGEMVPA